MLILVAAHDPAISDGDSAVVLVKRKCSGGEKESVCKVRHGIRSSMILRRCRRGEIIIYEKTVTDGLSCLCDADRLCWAHVGTGMVTSVPEENERETKAFHNPRHVSGFRPDFCSIEVKI